LAARPTSAIPSGPIIPRVSTASGRRRQSHSIKMKTTVIDVSNPANPRRVGGNSGFGASDVVVAGTNVFVAARYSGLVILDLFRPSLRLEPVSPQQPGGF